MKTKPKHVLLAGSSGMVGGIILQSCLNSSKIASVTSLVRSVSGITHPKLTEVVHADYTDLRGIQDAFKNKEVGHFCIGAYTGAVSDEVFKQITVDMAVAFGNALKAQSPEATLCFLSGQGADRTEKSRMSFARYKGMAENHLLASGFRSLYIFRPGYIYPVVKRKEPNFMYRLSRTLYPLMRRIYSKGVITSAELAQAMFKSGIEGTAIVTLENPEIKAIS